MTGARERRPPRTSAWPPAPARISVPTQPLSPSTGELIKRATMPDTGAVRRGGGSPDRPEPESPSGAFLRAQRELAQVPQQLADLMRPLLPVLVDQITGQIQERVTAYAGSASGRRRHLIEQAVGGAAQLFVDIIDGRTGSHARVQELFRRMGRGEAMEGNDLQAMRSACEIALRDAWEQLRTFALQEGLSADMLGTFADALFAFMDGVVDQVSVGYAAGMEALERDHNGRAHL